MSATRPPRETGPKTLVMSLSHYPGDRVLASLLVRSWSGRDRMDRITVPLQPVGPLGTPPPGADPILWRFARTCVLLEELHDRVRRPKDVRAPQGPQGGLSPVQPMLPGLK